jgi:hypothetical protein
VVAITPASYAIELAKIDLPYFKALVDLISLVRLEQEAERIERKKAAIVPTTEPVETARPESIEPVEEVKSVEEPAQPKSEPEPPVPEEQPVPKRSYEPKLTDEQYSLLAKCVEHIHLFRRPVTPAGLKKLFVGKLTEPLQVMNQLPLVYLLDQMRKAGYIKKAWMTVAFENRDFVSFRTESMERRYGSGPHHLTMEQLKSRRNDTKHKYIDGADEIEDAIESMQECGAK